MLIGLTGRANLDLNVLPDRSPLFVKLADGSIKLTINVGGAA